VEERAPWQLAKDEGAARELDQVLSSLVVGLRVVAVLLHPYMPASTDTLLNALGCEDRSLAIARWDASDQPGGDIAVGLGREIERVASLFPKAPEGQPK
jgi:methionyl-tRNA synthetase